MKETIGIIWKYKGIIGNCANVEIKTSLIHKNKLGGIII